MAKEQSESEKFNNAERERLLLLLELGLYDEANTADAVQKRRATIQNTLEAVKSPLTHSERLSSDEISGQPDTTTIDVGEKLKETAAIATAAARAAIMEDSEAWRQRVRGVLRVFGAVAVEAGGILLATGVLAAVGLIAGLLSPAPWVVGLSSVAVLGLVAGLIVWGMRPQPTTRELIERANNMRMASEIWEFESNPRKSDR